jgi:hypothetical protein
MPSSSLLMQNQWTPTFVLSQLSTTSPNSSKPKWASPSTTHQGNGNSISKQHCPIQGPPLMPNLRQWHGYLTHSTMGHNLLCPSRKHHPPTLEPNILIYHQFIDDIIRTWLCNQCPDQENTPWTSFQQPMQEWHSPEWEFSQLSSTCNFMDLTLTINKDQITYTLFENQRTSTYTSLHTLHTQKAF